MNEHIADQLKPLAVPLDSIMPDERNARVHGPRNIEALKSSLAHYGQRKPVVVRAATRTIIAGNGLWQAARELGWEQIAAVFVDDDETRAVGYALMDNQSALLSEWDEDRLLRIIDELQAEEFDLSLTGFSTEDLQAIVEKAAKEAGAITRTHTGASGFSYPTFSVIDRRSKQWQARRRAWLATAIKPELGRQDEMIFSRSAAPLHEYKLKETLERLLGRKIPWDEFSTYVKKTQYGTSVFDPVLCETVYRWFCPQGGTVLDPFAGGPPRGVVAGVLGCPYTGIDINPAQVEANESNLAEVRERIRVEPPPRWVVGDSRDVDTLLPKGEMYDLVFTCPPYYDLEQYTDDPRDLSRAPSYAEFMEAYRSIIERTAARLLPNRFAAFVVGNIRDRRGMVIDLVGDTIEAFHSAGLELYNDAVIIDPTSTAPIRARSLWRRRKLTRIHQYLLVFVKGDPKKAVEAMRNGQEMWADDPLATAYEEALETPDDEPEIAWDDLAQAMNDEDGLDDVEEDGSWGAV